MPGRMTATLIAQKDRAEIGSKLTTSLPIHFLPLSPLPKSLLLQKLRWNNLVMEAPTSGPLSTSSHPLPFAGDQVFACSVALLSIVAAPPGLWPVLLALGGCLTSLGQLWSTWCLCWRQNVCSQWGQFTSIISFLLQSGTEQTYDLSSFLACIYGRNVPGWFKNYELALVVHKYLMAVVRGRRWFLMTSMLFWKSVIIATFYRTKKRDFLEVKDRPYFYSPEKFLAQFTSEREKV